ncbi:phosphopantothenate--cysteine ligase family flavoprotein [Novosphingobium sp.]|uniref:bifunctional phosphopantothenoylcysteine decarboxylase/phosphopantothenate synthase n=1 Tax=Novosphingobium sp. TaxID=1874826 RepID=UPI0025D99102|nr:bifunctional phosphopantothenoylcysteine decarboxylase/phosphopantothenate synthase [Novosphingobium sp.]
MNGPKILLIVGGGIAAYKACELVRLIRRNGGEVSCVLTEGGSHFVTAMTLAALSENPVHTTLWDLTAEVEMGHIQLSRAADLVVVCPATANLMAKMVQGIADDLATTLLLATDKPVLAVPAMNVKMWEHAATQDNVRTLMERGVAVLDPDEGPMACGEYGAGRLPEPVAVWNAICQMLQLEALALPAPEPELALEAPRDFDSFAQSVDLGLGGLAAGLIKRTTTSKLVFGDDDLTIEGEVIPPVSADDEPAPEETPPDEVLLAAPILSKKGRAKSAPPTDPDAINHTVTGQTVPEPIKGDSFAGSKLADALIDDPLFGQPDFAGDDAFAPVSDRLEGKHVLVTAGPTHEPIDPVRYIANRSSGKQGYAIAAAAARMGAKVTLVSGPVALECPPGVDRVFVETAVEMADAVKKALPADAAVMVAAVADWRTTEVAGEKMKKRGSAPPALRLTENPDILASVASSPKRPRLVVGFAAETEKVIDHAKDKRKRKGADWIVANDVSGDVMGGEVNAVHIITETGVESLPEMAKDAVAAALVERIADALNPVSADPG